MKKNSLKKLPVIDPEKVDDSARAVLRQAWEELQDSELQAVSDLARDPVRQRIDRAICEALGLPEDPIIALRELLGSESRFARAAPKRRVLAQPSPDQRPLF